MAVKIEIIDFPTKLQMTQGRRKQYYKRGDKIPQKYLQNSGGMTVEGYTFKEGKLYDTINKEFVVKNAKSVDKPRFQHLSYNKINKRVLVAVLIRLKDVMRPFIPDNITIKTPCMIDCTVYDHPGMGNRDLDNMHIYYKAFLDLITDMGLIPDDSIQYITQSGGFRYTPISYGEERKLVFSIKEDNRSLVQTHLFFNDSPKVVTRGEDIPQQNAYELSAGEGPALGNMFVNDEEMKIIFNCGSKKLIHAHALKALGKVRNFLQNVNSGVWVDETFYRLHSGRLQQELLSKGMPVHIKTNGDNKTD